MPFSPGAGGTARPLSRVPLLLYLRCDGFQGNIHIPQVAEIFHTLDELQPLNFMERWLQVFSQNVSSTD
jgi:hypothetical protein